MLLFHATYRAYLPSIAEHGLLSDSFHGCWSWADEYGSSNSPFGSCVFLANDWHLAESFAESADNVADDVFDSGIIIVAMDSDDLDLDLLTYDPFYYPNSEEVFEDPYFEYLSVLEQAECLAYRGDIPASVVRFYVIDGFDLAEIQPGEF